MVASLLTEFLAPIVVSVWKLYDGYCNPPSTTTTHLPAPQPQPPPPPPILLQERLTSLILQKKNEVLINKNKETLASWHATPDRLLKLVIA